MSDTVMTPKFRVSFPDVFRPGKADDSGKQKYGVTMLFEPGADLTALKAEAMRAGKEKWGADETKWPKGWKNPFKEQGDKSYDGYVAGGKYISAKSSQKPGLVNTKNEDIIDESEFYAGCYARATVKAFAYEARNASGAVISRGIGFGLHNIQKLGDGDPFSGRIAASKEFTPVEPAGAGVGAGSADAKTAADLFG